MKKILDRKIVKVNAIVMIIGLFIGILFYFMLKSGDKITIRSEIIDYFNIIKGGSITINSFINSFNSKFIIISIILVSSIVYILMPIISIVNFYKGFSIGLYITLLISTFKEGSIKYILASIFPHEIAFILLIIAYSSIMMNYSIELFRLTKDNKSLDIKLYAKRIITLYIIALIICLIITLLELFININIVRLVL